MAKFDIDWARATLASMRSLADRWHGPWMQVTDVAADRVDVCPAQAIGGDWPGWSAVLAARQVGLAAVETGVFDARDAVKAGIRVLLNDADSTREFQRVQDWIVDLPRPARLDVADEALRWLVAWHSINPKVEPGAVVPGGAIRKSIAKQVALRASVDMLVRDAGAVDQTAYVSVGSVAITSDDRATAARLAALLWLDAKSVGTVVVTHPKSRELRTFDVDVELVSAGAEQFVSAMRVMINQATGEEEAPTIPGPQCRWCDRRDSCTDGQAYLVSHPGSSGGLPRHS